MEGKYILFQKSPDVIESSVIISKIPI